MNTTSNPTDTPQKHHLPADLHGPMADLFTSIKASPALDGIDPLSQRLLLDAVNGVYSQILRAVNSREALDSLGLM